MPHAIMVVAAYPASPELEDDLNIWYSDVHMSDVLAVPGVVGFTRYRRAAEPELLAGPLGAPYLSIVTIDAEDVDATLQELRSRNGTDAMPRHARSRSGSRNGSLLSRLRANRVRTAGEIGRTE